MTKIHSLGDLIAKKAVEFADQIRVAVAMADKEEEIRIAAEKLKSSLPSFKKKLV